MMARNKFITISMIVLGAVLFATAAPHSDWGWSGSDKIEVPAVSANWTGGGMADSPAQITVASPPYIILEAIPNQGQHVDMQSAIRISVQTMSGTYSEYVASTLANQQTQPVSFVRSRRLGSLAGPPLGITAWE